MNYDALDTSRTQRTLTGAARLLLALHLDGPLFVALCLVGAVGSDRAVQRVGPQPARCSKRSCCASRSGWSR